MLKRLSPRELLEQLASTWSATIRSAWVEAIDGIRSAIVLKRVVEMLERGDIAGAIRALNLDESAYGPVVEAIRATFNAGGVAEIGNFPLIRDPEGHRLVIRWDMRNLAAEAWLREHSSTLISRILADQIEAIREALAAGLARGDNPTRTVLNVIGRINRATGRREGGVIGLTAAQARYVENAIRELLSGDPEALRNYLGRERRDKRFDRTIAKAIAEGRGLPVEAVNRIVGRYSDNLLKLRGDTLALSETMSALAASRDLAFRQQIESGKLRADVVTKRWRHTPQEKPRVQHVAMQGQEVPFDQPFKAPDGTMIPYPHAPGVPLRHKIGCKCMAEYRVDFIAHRFGR